MKLPGPLTTDQEKQLRTVQTSARHLLALINDMLDLAKIEADKVELDLKPVDCVALIEEIATTLRPQADSKGLKLLVQVPEQATTIKTDRRALSQIMINLTANAIKFTEHGSIAVALRRRHEGGCSLLEFSVEDTGIGIPAADQGKLFTAFSRAGTPQRQTIEGSGLGLHLSQKLAGLLGGSVSFVSEHGTGSTFTLVLREP